MNTEKKKKVKKSMLPPTAESVQHRKTRKPAMRHRWHTSQNWLQKTPVGIWQGYMQMMVSPEQIWRKGITSMPWWKDACKKMEISTWFWQNPLADLPEIQLTVCPVSESWKNEISLSTSRKSISIHWNPQENFWSPYSAARHRKKAEISAKMWNGA